MRRSLVVATCAFAGCRQTLPPAAPIPQLVVVAAPVVPRASFHVVAAELGDDGVLERIRHRTRVRRMGRASATHGAPTKPIIERTHAAEVDLLLPVIGESATEIRVVIDHDDARTAWWIDRADTWPTLLAPIQLADREGRAPRAAGAWISAGAPIDAAFGTDQLRHVTLRDPDVSVVGWVPATVVGNVWIAAPGDTRTHVKGYATYDFTPPRDPRPQQHLAVGAKLRAAADPSAPIVAVVVGMHVVGAVVHRAHGWAELELVRPYAKIRGYVVDTDVLPADGALITHGTGTGSGFGMSHRDRIEIPAGTCLFDRENGEVAGVQTTASERYGKRTTDTLGWSQIYIDNPWGVSALFVHDTGSDPKQPVWESCAKPH